MKQILGLFLTFVICFCASGCTKTQTETPTSSVPTSSISVSSLHNDIKLYFEDTMPGDTFYLLLKDGTTKTFTSSTYDYSRFYEIHDKKVRYIDTAWYEAVGAEKVINWVNEYKNAKKSNKTDYVYPALVKMIKDLGISKTVCNQVIKEIQSKYNSNHALYLSDDDLKVILSFDRVAIDDRFVNPESIRVNGVTYTGNWLATHTIADYQKAGITIEMVEQLIGRYGSFIYLYEEFSNEYYNKYIEYQAVYDQPPYFDGYTMPLGTSWAWFRNKYPNKVRVESDVWASFFDSEKIYKWAKNKSEHYEATKNDVMRDQPYPDAVQIILDLNIPIEIARQALKAQGQAEGVDPYATYLSDEDIEVLLSLDQSAIDKRFPGECVFYLNTRSYTLMWLMNHSVQEYMAYGITSTALEEKIPIIENKLQNGNYKNYSDIIKQKLADLKALEQKK